MKGIFRKAQNAGSNALLFFSPCPEAVWQPYPEDARAPPATDCISIEASNETRDRSYHRTLLLKRHVPAKLGLATLRNFQITGETAGLQGRNMECDSVMAGQA